MQKLTHVPLAIAILLVDSSTVTNNSISNAVAVMKLLGAAGLETRNNRSSILDDVQNLKKLVTDLNQISLRGMIDLVPRTKGRDHFLFLGWLGGLLVERRTCVSQILGSIPGQVAAV